MDEILKKWQTTLKEMDAASKAGNNDPEFIAAIEMVEEFVQDLECHLTSHPSRAVETCTHPRVFKDYEGKKRCLLCGCELSPTACLTH